MKQLEDRLISEAKKQIPELRKRVNILKKQVKRRFFVFPLVVDGVYDQIQYDSETDKFKIIYIVGKGKGVQFEEGAGYFRKTEKREIAL
ncbi:MAG: hypothetical protein PHW73_00300 [Atribacterota bacterium]|nr:hypothetical protein [Atribacterota bacterium]